jgi:hypothetical protein
LRGNKKKRASKQSLTDKTECLDLDKDGHQLWKLARALNEENISRTPVTLEKEKKMLSGKKEADKICKLKNV